MATDDWATGREVEELLFRFNRGPVDLDPCSNDRSIIRAKRRFTAGGTHLPWNARRIYENPPYSALLRWTLYGLEQLRERHRGEPKELVRLVTCSPSTEWWAHAVAAEGLLDGPLIIIPKRLCFIDEQGREADSPARFDSAFFVYASRGRQEQFLRVFEPLARFVQWCRGEERELARATIQRIAAEKEAQRARRRKAA